MTDERALGRVLETVLYCDASNAAEVRSFYSDTLGLPRLGNGPAHRIGDGLLLVFDVEESSVQDDPPPHGARGPIHACFVCDEGSYESWKVRLGAANVRIIDEKEWPNGVQSFYFADPAGNLLEIADGDMWPG